MRRARAPGDRAGGVGALGALAHRAGFAVLDARERLSPWVRWPLHLAARLHRRRHPDVPLVAVSGSTGKTTTQSLVAHLLQSRFAVIATPDGYNSDLTYHREVLRSRRGAGHVLVLECGIQRPGNADRWNRGIDPDVVILTNVGDTHLAWLGDRAGVLAEKLKLARNLRPGGTLLVNADDPLLAAVRAPARIVGFAVHGDADWVARDVVADASGLRLTVTGPHGSIALESRLLGPRNAYAITAAVACASILGVAPDAIALGVASFEPRPGRLVRLERGGLTILDDAGSSSPQAVSAGLEALALMPGRRIAVLGDMLELGSAGPRLHAEVGREIAAAHPELQLFTCGPLARRISEAAVRAGHDPSRVRHAESKLDLLRLLHETVADGDVVLVKGSHGTRMDQVVAAIGEPPYAPPLRPMPAVRAIGAFGAQRHPERLHEGVDLPVALGSPVHAFADGEVLSARFEPGYGKVLRLRHLTNVETVYAHLGRFRVRRGRVSRGQEIAESGRSGILHTGSEYDYPHLHFEVRVAGVAVDPGRWFADVVPAEPA